MDNFLINNGIKNPILHMQSESESIHQQIYQRN